MRASLRFLFSDDGAFFREFLLDEIVGGVDALSRDASRSLAMSIGLRGSLIPGPLRALAPELTDRDRKVIDNIQRLLAFFLGDESSLMGDAGSAGEALAKAFLQPLASLSPSAAQLLSRSNPSNRAEGLMGGFATAGSTGLGGLGGPRSSSSNEDINPVTDRLWASSSAFGGDSRRGVGFGGGSNLSQMSQELAPVLAEFAPAMRVFGRQIVGRLAEKLTARLVRYTATEVFGARLTESPSSERDSKEGEAVRSADGRMAASF